MRPTWKSIVTALVVALGAGLLPVSVASTAEAATHCRTHWGASVKKQVRAVDGPITGVHARRRACFDRLIVDLEGTAPGYRVGYVSNAGIGMPLRGRTQLAVLVQSSRFQVGHCFPVVCDGVGGDPLPTNWRDMINLRGFHSVRQVAITKQRWSSAPVPPENFLVITGGETQYGVGVRRRLPFRVFTRQDATTSRLVIDVAHRRHPRHRR
jgi:hypothetical protein